MGESIWCYLLIGTFCQQWNMWTRIQAGFLFLTPVNTLCICSTTSKQAKDLSSPGEEEKSIYNVALLRLNRQLSHKTVMYAGCVSMVNNIFITIIIKEKWTSEKCIYIQIGFMCHELVVCKHRIFFRWENYTADERLQPRASVLCCRVFKLKSESGSEPTLTLPRPLHFSHKRIHSFWKRAHICLRIMLFHKVSPSGRLAVLSPREWNLMLLSQLWWKPATLPVFF